MSADRRKLIGSFDFAIWCLQFIHFLLLCALQEMADEKENKITEVKESDQKVYEVGYLLVPSIPEENVPAMHGDLKELVSSFGGEPISDEIPRMLPLAYTISKVVSNVRGKWNNAYFGWVKFYIEAGQISKLKEKLDQDPNLIRFLLIKTVKENTIAAKRFMHRSPTHGRPVRERKEGDVPPVPINKEEIDKEIDAMVAV